MRPGVAALDNTNCSLITCAQSRHFRIYKFRAVSLNFNVYHFESPQYLRDLAERLFVSGLNQDVSFFSRHRYLVQYRTDNHAGVSWIRGLSHQCPGLRAWLISSSAKIEQLSITGYAFWKIGIECSDAHRDIAFDPSTTQDLRRSSSTPHLP